MMLRLLPKKHLLCCSRFASATTSIYSNGIKSTTGATTTLTNINFNDSKVAFRSKTLNDLLRAKVVFTACQIRPLVLYAESLIRTSYKYLGNGITTSLLRLTFFGHFCAGEDAETIKPTVDYLKMHGIGSILDYAAEADITATEGEEGGAGDASSKSLKQSSSQTTPEDSTQCRVYEYKDEVMCDVHTETFKKCITAVKSVSPTGFAAIKCTALGNPKLLERMSIVIIELKQLFNKFDHSNTGYVTKSQFIEAYNKYFNDDNGEKVFLEIDSDHDGSIDYIEWMNGLPIEDLDKLMSACRELGPLSKASLDDNERQLVKKMRERIYSLAKLAKDLGVRLMIDAEHTYFQPAIDNITVDLAKKYNIDYPVIFSTYQMYLKDSSIRLKTDIDRAKKGNYIFAAKLVRGAYMVVERSRSEKLGIDDPIHLSLQATHDNYNNSVNSIIEEMGRSKNANSNSDSDRNSIEIMVASHNQKSVELAIESMNRNGLPPSSGVYFGQLLGMSDHLSFTLGSLGYKAYKYVPYGKVNEVMPYLIRRAHENSDALSGAKIELNMINKEIKNRLFNST